MSLLLLFHPQVVGGVNPVPFEIVRELAQGGGAVYPQQRGQLKRRKAKEDAEFLQMLAIVIPLIEGLN